jgi:hypothetical protein
MPIHRDRGPWRSLHDAKNDLTGAVLLLGRLRGGANVDLAVVEGLIRRAVTRIDEIPGDYRGRARATPRSAS